MSEAAQARNKKPELTARRADQTLTVGCRFFGGNLCPVANVILFNLLRADVAAIKANGPANLTDDALKRYPSTYRTT
jgi:hypothetical protein